MTIYRRETTTSTLEVSHENGLSSRKADSFSSTTSGVSSSLASLNRSFITLGYSSRALILFSLGIMFAIVLNILQMEHRSNLTSNLFVFASNTWWLWPSCGIAAIYIGFVYPFFDHKLGLYQHNDGEVTLIIRSVAFFIGLNHLCVKITFANFSHFFLILGMFCMVFWYWFDKTKFGLIFNVFNAVIANILVHYLRNFGFIKISDIELSYVQICLLCLIFSGGITFGNIGRLLDFYDFHHTTTTTSKRQHVE